MYHRRPVQRIPGRKRPKKLTAEQKNKLDYLIGKFLSKVNDKAMAQSVDQKFEYVRRQYQVDKFTVGSYLEFKRAIVKIWRRISSYACISPFPYLMSGIKRVRANHIPMFPKAKRKENQRALMYLEDLFHFMNVEPSDLYKIGQDPELGGMPRVFEMMIRAIHKIEYYETVRMIALRCFGKCKDNYEALRYIAVKYQNFYRPSREEELLIQDFYIFPIFDKSENDIRFIKNKIDLLDILTMHLKYKAF